VKLLLDTHTFLWYATGNSQLSAQAKSYIDNRQNVRYVSAATLWEIAIKYSIGKLTLKEPYEILIPRLLQVNTISKKLGYRLSPQSSLKLRPLENPPNPPLKGGL
jgi:PIN domain nuclease of toxin-antitoxin system